MNDLGTTILKRIKNQKKDILKRQVDKKQKNKGSVNLTINL
jgi:hypothetical protein